MPTRRRKRENAVRQVCNKAKRETGSRQGVLSKLYLGRILASVASVVPSYTCLYVHWCSFSGLGTVYTSKKFLPWFILCNQFILCLHAVSASSCGISSLELPRIHIHIQCSSFGIHTPATAIQDPSHAPICALDSSATQTGHNISQLPVFTSQ